MAEHEASRTLVKSSPELWAECSEANSLARHLNGSFGEIRITRLEPETAVAWEGDEVSGTVRLEPSGWGTRVTLTATCAGSQPPEVSDGERPALVPVPPPTSPEPEPDSEQEPEPEREPDPLPPAAAEPARPRGRLLTWLRRRWGVETAEVALEPIAAPPLAEAGPEPPVAEPDPEPPAAEPEPEPPVAEPEPEPDPHQDALSAALDSLGKAHHRPFSRA